MIQLPLISAITTLGGSMLKIVDQFVVDKDLKQKLAIRQLELTYGLIEKIVNTTTVPWVDALVKVLMSFVVLARPLGTFALTVFGLYAYYKGIEIDPTVHATVTAAFPAWGAVREVGKSREEKTKRIAAASVSSRPNFLDTYDG